MASRDPSDEGSESDDSLRHGGADDGPGGGSAAGGGPGCEGSPGGDVDDGAGVEADLARDGGVAGKTPARWGRHLSHPTPRARPPCRSTLTDPLAAFLEDRSQASFLAFVDEVSVPVRAVARLVYRQAEDDIVQTVYERILKDDWTPPEFSSGRAVACRLARDIARKLRRQDAARHARELTVGMRRLGLGSGRLVDKLGPIALAVPAEPSGLSEDERRAFRSAILELPPVPREFILLAQEAGLSAAEIAEMLGVSERTVRRHLHDGYAILKTKLAGVLPAAALAALGPELGAALLLEPVPAALARRIARMAARKFGESGSTGSSRGGRGPRRGRGIRPSGSSLGSALALALAAPAAKVGFAAALAFGIVAGTVAASGAFRRAPVEVVAVDPTPEPPAPPDPALEPVDPLPAPVEPVPPPEEPAPAGPPEVAKDAEPKNDPKAWLQMQRPLLEPALRAKLERAGAASAEVAVVDEDGRPVVQGIVRARTFMGRLEDTYEMAEEVYQAAKEFNARDVRLALSPRGTVRVADIPWELDGRPMNLRLEADGWAQGGGGWSFVPSAGRTSRVTAVAFAAAETTVVVRDAADGRPIEGARVRISSHPAMSTVVVVERASSEEAGAAAGEAGDGTGGPRTAGVVLRARGWPGAEAGPGAARGAGAEGASGGALAGASGTRDGGADGGKDGASRKAAELDETGLADGALDEMALDEAELAAGALEEMVLDEAELEASARDEAAAGSDPAEADPADPEGPETGASESDLVEGEFIIREKYPGEWKEKGLDADPWKLFGGGGPSASGGRAGAPAGKSGSGGAASRKAAPGKASSGKTASGKPSSGKQSSAKQSSGTPSSGKAVSGTPASSKAASTKSTSARAASSKEASGSTAAGKRAPGTTPSNPAKPAPLAATSPSTTTPSPSAPAGGPPAGTRPAEDASPPAGTATPRRVGSGTTDANGEVVLVSYGRGRRTIEVDATGYLFEQCVVDEAPERREFRLRRVQPPPYGTVLVGVADAWGRPVEGAAATVEDSAGTETSTDTDELGRAVLSGIRAGKVKVSVAWPAGVTPPAGPEGPLPPVTVTLPPGDRIEALFGDAERILEPGAEDGDPGEDAAVGEGPEDAEDGDGGEDADGSWDGEDGQDAQGAGGAEDGEDSERAEGAEGAFAPGAGGTDGVDDVAGGDDVDGAGGADDVAGADDLGGGDDVDGAGGADDVAGGASRGADDDNDVVDAGNGASATAAAGPEGETSRVPVEGAPGGAPARGHPEPRWLPSRDRAPGTLAHAKAAPRSRAGLPIRRDGAPSGWTQDAPGARIAGPSPAAASSRPAAAKHAGTVANRPGIAASRPGSGSDGVAIAGSIATSPAAALALALGGLVAWAPAPAPEAPAKPTRGASASGSSSRWSSALESPESPTQGASTRGSSAKEAPTQGAPEKGAPARGSSTKGSPTKGSPARGTSTRGTSTKGAPRPASKASPGTGTVRVTVLDVEGHAVAGVSVTLTDGAKKSWTCEKVHDGPCTFSGLPPGAGIVDAYRSVRPGGGRPGGTESLGSRVFLLQPGRMLDLFLGGDAPPCALEATAADGRGRPLAGATVELVGAGAKVPPATTDAKGKVAIGNVPQGMYEAYLTDGATRWLLDPSLDLTPGKPVPRAWKLDGRTVSGKVAAPDIAGKPRPPGRTVADARVRIAVGEREATTGVAADGSWTISGVPAGDHRLTATLPGDEDGTIGALVATAMVRVPAGKDVRGIDLVLGETGDVVVAVLDPAGEPVLDADVRAVDGRGLEFPLARVFARGARPSEHTGADLPVGRYELRIETPSGARETAEVEVAPDLRSRVEVEIDAP